MKNILLVFSLAFFFLQAQAQTEAESPTYFTDMATAKEFAKANNKDILMVFAGSDWCRPCIQFKKEILEATNFQEWSNDKLIVLYLDFPARKKNKLSEEATAHNEALAERFNKSGLFPNVFILDAEEKVLANPKYTTQTAEAFKEEVQPSLSAF